jgi:hypothetical protein
LKLTENKADTVVTAAFITDLSVGRIISGLIVPQTVRFDGGVKSVIDLNSAKLKKIDLSNL